MVALLDFSDRILPFPFTPHQLRALSKLNQFLQTKTPTEPLGIFGYAGSGKSSCVVAAVKLLVEQGYRIAMTGASNRAVEQLEAIASEHNVTGVQFMTIHSLLGLSLVSNRSEKVLHQASFKPIPAFEIIFIDECSMIDSRLWAEILKLAQGDPRNLIQRKSPHIVLLGDPGQLNPVNEIRSPSFNVQHKAVLTQNVRQNAGPLQDYTTQLRDYLSFKPATKKLPVFQPYSQYSPNKRTGVILVNRSSLMRYACSTLTQQFAQTSHRFRILCWTNAAVDQYNREIREFLHSHNPPPFLVGERLIARAPIYAPDRRTQLFPTSAEFTIQSVTLDRYSNFQAWRLGVQSSAQELKQIYVLDPADQEKFDAQTVHLYLAAQRNPYLWRKYHQHLETFAAVRHCYAITIHNAQGLTVEEVAIDAQDLRHRIRHPTQRNILEHNKLHYVAATRAKRRVLILP
jgi:ATP-dependent exoDNAse (exonuclease V) alpha subunit